ncbi:MAG TPA: hypothetical protein PLZ51_16185 [Aggregatilineales bacterium]|nr:hypothetical protein [Aggregatilineales bacterium]
MTLQDILEVIDTLPREDLEQVEQRIHHRKKLDDKPKDAPVLDDAWALAQIREILKDVPPTPIIYGTMDVDKLIAGIKEMREGLSED